MKYNLRSLPPNQVVLAGFFGAFASGGAYALYGLAYEHFVMPSTAMAYGQQAGAMAVVAGCLGACVGISLVVACCGWVLRASVLNIAASVAVALLVGLLWMDSNRRYGADPSDNLVFLPTMFIAFVTFILGAVLAVFAFVRRPLKPRPAL